ncbi:FtsB family cell division protein [Lactobacillaceae bacterium Scapto_B20]
MKDSNVQRLTNSYTKRHYRRQKWGFLKRPRSRRICLFAGIFLVVAIYLTVNLVSAKYQDSQVQKQIRTSKQSLATAKVTNEKLKLNVKQLNNAEYVQQLIRDKYYYTKSGETVYSLPNDVAKDVTQN